MDDVYRTVHSFWFSRPDMWFSPSSADDKAIHHSLFRHVAPAMNITPSCQDDALHIGRIILLDQVPRHSKRVIGLPSKNIKAYTKTARKISYSLLERLHDFTPEKLCFILLPLRHLKCPKDIKRTIDVMKRVRNDTGHSICTRFLRAAYKDLLLANNKTKLAISTEANYEYESVLETGTMDFSIPTALDNRLKHCFHDIPTYMVSLSGGVDSVLCLVCMLSMGMSPCAVHINYMNRETSLQEESFVTDLCRRLRVKLFVRRFDEIKRNDIDRDIYEEVTKLARFDCYRRIGGKVILGHHRDDSLENIVSNISQGKKFNNLRGMDRHMDMLGVHLCRPLLQLGKSDILSFAHHWGIPYLYDSTRQECTRGRLRKFIPQMDAFDKTLTPGLHKVDRVLHELFLQLETQCKDIAKQAIQSNNYCSFRIPVDFGAIAWRTLLSSLGFYHISNKSIDNLVWKITKAPRSRRHMLNKFWEASWEQHDDGYTIEIKQFA